MVFLWVALFSVLVCHHILHLLFVNHSLSLFFCRSMNAQPYDLMLVIRSSCFSASKHDIISWWNQVIQRLTFWAWLHPDDELACTRFLSSTDYLDCHPIVVLWDSWRNLHFFVWGACGYPEADAYLIWGVDALVAAVGSWCIACNGKWALKVATWAVCQIYQMSIQEIVLGFLRAKTICKPDWFISVSSVYTRCWEQKEWSLSWHHTKPMHSYHGCQDWIPSWVVFLHSSVKIMTWLHIVVLQ